MSDGYEFPKDRKIVINNQIKDHRFIEFSIHYQQMSLFKLISEQVTEKTVKTSWIFEGHL
jgi:hypothetical protein